MNNNKNYQTKQKNIIREIFVNNPNDYFTVDKIMLLLRNNKTPVSRATLYRNIDFMIDSGEIIKYCLDGNTSCYQYKTCEHTNHIHFKCQSCGSILHIENPIIKKMDEKIEEEYKISIDSTRTMLYGKCSKCKGGKA